MTFEISGISEILNSTILTPPDEHIDFHFSGAFEHFDDHQINMETFDQHPEKGGKEGVQHRDRNSKTNILKK